MRDERQIRKKILSHNLAVPAVQYRENTKDKEHIFCFQLRNELGKKPIAKLNLSKEREK